MDIVILAGGSGTRMWPVSRRAQPKQFQALATEQSLIRETFERVRPLAEPAHIHVATVGRLVDLCRQQLPELPPENIFVEPVLRNTGPAIGYATAVLARRDPAAVIATVHADHLIGRPERFREALRLAAETVTASPATLVTIGLQPTWGNPGFGYLHAPGAVGGEALRVVRVQRFEEKPSPELAARYVASGDYLWNAGYFTFRADTMLRCIGAQDRPMAEGLHRIAAAAGTPTANQVLAEEYPALPKIPIDQLVFEPESQAGRVVTIAADLAWDDLGSWKTLRDVQQARTGESVVTRGEVITVDTRNTLVLGGHRLIATIGVDDLIVVDTPDALLICRADRAEDVRQVLAQLPPDDPRQ